MEYANGWMPRKKLKTSKQNHCDQGDIISLNYIHVKIMKQAKRKFSI